MNHKGMQVKEAAWPWQCQIVFCITSQQRPSTESSKPATTAVAAGSTAATASGAFKQSLQKSQTS
jgi:hypothetical protein